MQKVVKADGKTADIDAMFDAGAHYGYSKSKRHPSVSSFIYTTKNSGDIIDLEKTGEMLASALEFVKKQSAANKVMLLVGTKPEARESVRSAGSSLDLPYVDARWIGGTLSNFGEIKKRIVELETYNKEVEDGSLSKYTKRERTMLAKKMEKLNKYYGGLLGLKKIPDLIFVIDPKAEHIATTEATKSNVPVVALANSDTDIREITYPVVANDGSAKSIKFFTKQIVEAWKEGALTRTQN